jgi:PAS domain S-box-containing protein
MKQGGQRAGRNEAVRREAEARLAQGKGRKPRVPARSATDLQALVHELEVHQVELEMQNEELRRAHAEAEDLRARYEDLFDFAPLGYVTLDNLGLIVDANLAAAALLGSDRSSLTRRPLVGLVAPECRAGLAGFLSEVRQVPGKKSIEARIVTGGGVPIDVAVDAVLLWGRGAADDLLQVALVDVTERRRVEAEKGRLVRELEASLANVKRLSGLLPICASCKRIRDDRGYWQQVEAYVSDHSEAEFSHGVCPECANKLYPEFRK